MDAKETVSLTEEIMFTTKVILLKAWLVRKIHTYHITAPAVQLYTVHTHTHVILQFGDKQYRACFCHIS